MKNFKNLPIYLLSASLLFIGVTSVSQAQGAASVTSQIRALQKQVKALQSDLTASLGLVNFAQMQLGDRITPLENRNQSPNTKTEELTYSVVGTGLLWCTSSHRDLAQKVVTYSSPYVSFGLCSTKVLVP